MFTGLIEETGIVSKRINNPDGIELDIQAKKILEDLKINDSISCSGICLTVTRIAGNKFTVQLVEETLKRTNAKSWDKGIKINLERSLLPSTRLGGHFVQGHIDTVTTIHDIINKKDSATWYFVLNKKIDKYIVEKGSICLDGISLTVVMKNKKYFSVALIPHTLNVTNWNQKNIGDLINVEVDIMAKYIENFLGEKDAV